jgi:hypothetical protein
MAMNNLKPVIQFPKKSNLPEDQQHFLAYIPWDDKYLEDVPQKYLTRFIECLPYLGARTTNVHVAVCFRYFNELITNFEKHTPLKVDKDIVGLALILHDIGWGHLSEDEIAASLGIQGLKLNHLSKRSKEKHAVIGEKLARKLLEKWKIDTNKADLICECVRWHDLPEKVVKNNQVPPEVQVLTDLDHIWSFTQENFWLDTIRKGVDPRGYAKNLANDMETYFVTETGKYLAKKLLCDRIKEID